MRSSLALAALLAFAACGGDPSPAPAGGGGAAVAGKPAATLLADADTAEQAGDWKTVLACANGALADAKATGEEKQEAWLRRIAAEAHVHGTEATKTALTQMTASGDVPPAGKLVSLATDLANNDQAAAAVEVVAAADAKYGSDPVTKKQLKKVAKMCQAKLTESGDAGALAQLQALGYLSASDDEEDE
ncbi:MAG: hypothetical protein FJ293_02585 [Planctomycetes bacterium]|nr:hypothetical protein [Planctomycetota bacterium]